jgi:hypothetical protein
MENQTNKKRWIPDKKEAQVAAAEIAKGILPPLKPMPIDEYFDKWVKLYKSNLTE